MNLYGLEESDAQSIVPLKENMYQYNGKERETSLNLHWYDYGARQYDVQLGRWNGVDLLAEKYSAFSPYNYVGSNPVNFIDPDGKRIINADEALMDNAEKNLINKRNWFRGKYGHSNTGLTKSDFNGDKAAWKEYKEDAGRVKGAEENMTKATDAYIQTAISLSHYKEVDPKGFNKMNSLTYRGENVDINITSHMEPNGSGKGQTIVSSWDDTEVGSNGKADSNNTHWQTSSLIPDPYGRKLLPGESGKYDFIIKLSRIDNRFNLDLRKNDVDVVIAHEFGHISYWLKNPGTVYDSRGDVPGLNCRAYQHTEFGRKFVAGARTPEKEYTKRKNAYLENKR